MDENHRLMGLDHEGKMGSKPFGKKEKRD